jgi:hypothetical protein
MSSKQPTPLPSRGGDRLQTNGVTGGVNPGKITSERPMAPAAPPAPQKKS